MRIAQHKFYGRLVAVAALAALAMTVGCKRQSDPRKVSGQIAVEGGSASGATVELYNAPSSTAGLWATTAQRPSVGFPYSVASVFDFRAERRQSSTHQSTLLMTTHTDVEGKFEFPDVPEGVYVVVAQKTGFGWTRPEMADTRNGNSVVGTVTLYPEQVYPAGTAITGSERWLSGHHYVVAANANFSLNAGASLIIEPGAVVRMGNLCEFRVRGTLDCQGTAADPILFTTSDLENPSSASGWQYLHFYTTAAPPLFRYCSFTYGDQAILSDVDGGRVEYCYFGNIASEAIALMGQGTDTADSVLVTGNVFDHIQESLRIERVLSSRLAISHNVFYSSSKYGLEMKLIRGGEVYCNWFGNCGRADTLNTSQTGGASLQDIEDTRISRNEFQSCLYSIVLGSRVDSTTHIENNRMIRSYRAIYVGYTPDEAGASYPQINNNCFERTENACLYHTACLINTHVIDVTNNYWYTTSETTVRSKILDCDDDVNCPCDEYTPFLMTCPTTEAGLCP